MLHSRLKRTSKLATVARLVLVLALLAVPSLALGSEASDSVTHQADVLARFHRAKPVGDPASGAWSLAQAEFYVSQYSAAGSASDADRADTLARFHNAKPVSDPASGAWSLAQAEFYVSRYGGERVATSASRTSGGFSGDDPYDPAAGGTPELSVVAVSRPALLTAASSFSGDDPYDPAAGGTPELSVAAVSRPAVPSAASSFSGDDPYDPAAGGTPELSVAPKGREVALTTPGGVERGEP